MSAYVTNTNSNDRCYLNLKTVLKGINRFSLHFAIVAKTLLVISISFNSNKKTIEVIEWRGELIKTGMKKFKLF